MPHQCLKCGVLFNEGTTTILRGCPECRGTRFFYTQKPLTMTERDKLLATSEITLRDAIDQLVKKAKEGDVTDLPKGPEDWVKVTMAEQPAAAPVPPLKTLEDFEGPAPEPAPTPVKFTPAAAPVPTSPTEPIADPKPKHETAWFIGNKLLIKRTPDAASPRRRNEIQFDYAPPTPVLETPTAFKTQPEPPAPVASGPTSEPLPNVAPDPEIITPLGDGPPETIRIGKPGQYEIDVKRLLEASPIVIQRDGTYLIHLASLFESNRPKSD
ncbi:MAG TPA: Zn-ribbon containing protein [Candidatus Thermoplasmatota archaeon]